ncbi:unnamed protein product [Gadus morhua 'NCC']
MAYRSCAVASPALENGHTETLSLPSAKGPSLQDLFCILPQPQVTPTRAQDYASRSRSGGWQGRQQETKESTDIQGRMGRGDFSRTRTYAFAAV